jgi:hypothetical protein
MSNLQIVDESVHSEMAELFVCIQSMNRNTFICRQRVRKRGWNGSVL